MRDGMPNPKIHVLFDAYAVKGLQPGQVTYLHALSHLSPTALYGVTFDRGTSVEYGDRRHLFISGTASIDHRGEVVHVGDVRGRSPADVGGAECSKSEGLRMWRR